MAICFENVVTTLDIYSQKYDKFVLCGDFNSEHTESSLLEFLSNSATLEDPVDTELEKCKDLPSVEIITENASTESSFHFTEIRN